jgi:hypothetical protein
MVAVVVIVVDARFFSVCTTIGQSGVAKWCNDASVAEMFYTLNQTSSGGWIRTKARLIEIPCQKIVISHLDLDIHFCLKVLNQIFLNSFFSKICFDVSSNRQFTMTENFGKPKNIWVCKHFNGSSKKINANQFLPPTNLVRLVCLRATIFGQMSMVGFSSFHFNSIYDRRNFLHMCFIALQKFRRNVKWKNACRFF